MLEVKEITKIFSSRIIFKNISFTLQRQQLLHVVGKNGAGKTTLLRVIVALLAVDAGEIVYANGSAHRLCEYLPADSGGFFQHLSAWDNLLWWAGFKNQRLDKDKARHLLQMLEIRFPRTLALQHFSTGMRRRLHLARFLLSPSPLWVMDEPFSGLDKAGIELFRKEIISHLTGDGALIIVSHNSAGIADKVDMQLDLDAEQYSG